MAELFQKFKRCIGKPVLYTSLAALALAGVGCEKEATEYNTLIGQVYQLDQRELSYIDTQGFGSSNEIPVPITFLGIDSEGEKYEFLLTGPHNIKKGDNVDLTYLVDHEVTGQEIWNRFYPGRSNSHLIDEPSVIFKVDGHIQNWMKE